MYLWQTKHLWMHTIIMYAQKISRNYIISWAYVIIVYIVLLLHLKENIWCHENSSPIRYLKTRYENLFYVSEFLQQLSIKP